MQRRREIKKARKQAGTQNTRSIGELPGRAFGAGDVGDVVEDAEYGRSAGRYWSASKSEGAGEVEEGQWMCGDPGCTSNRTKMPTGCEGREASGRPREANADAEDHERR